jgi:hypothetical protein
MCIKGSALTVTCMLAIFNAAAVYAQGLSTVSDAVEAQQRDGSKRAEAAKGERSVPVRTEPNQGRKISTYNLLGNPAFKHGIGVSGKTGFSPGRNGMPLGGRYQTEPASSPSGGSDCREVQGNPTPPGRQEIMTACYVLKLDNYWKTQTYVSRRSQAGNADWSGGLAIGYDY